MMDSDKNGDVRREAADGREEGVVRPPNPEGAGEAGISAEPGSAPGGAEINAGPGSAPAGAEINAGPGSAQAGAETSAEPGSAQAGAEINAGPGSAQAGAETSAEPENAPAGVEISAEPGSAQAGAETSAEPGSAQAGAKANVGLESAPARAADVGAPPAPEASDAGQEARKRRAARAKKEIREWVVSIALALIAVFLIRSFLFTVIRVDGSSMAETLHDGERLIVTVLDVKLGGVQRGDVVICHYPSRTGLFGIKENFVKRVVGVSGDKILMLNGVTFVNGERVDEPYVAYPSPHYNGAWEVPQGHVFVCGDNRAGSNDSRNPQVGSIAQDEVVGKVRLVMWPLSGWRVIE
jgi:signal peptidase I